METPAADSVPVAARIFTQAEPLPLPVATVHSVVLPMRLNEDLEFLEGIREKDRITLFANAGCALTCPSKLCYPSISRFNKGGGGDIKCSQSLKERDMFGMVDFPLRPYIDLGFHRFKLLRGRLDGTTGF